jgi:hypothetical protein|tara:strand:+ start:393 stop:503 length:111 start_codon:yes stop_codon:yes gene_type:complete
MSQSGRIVLTERINDRKFSRSKYMIDPCDQVGWVYP